MGIKLLVAFLAVGVIPFAVIGIISLIKSSEALSDQAFGQLQAVRGIKKAQTEKFFEERKGDMGVLVETAGTLRKEAFQKLEAIQEIKKAQIENYFKKLFRDMEVFARSRDVADLYNKLFEYHRAMETKAEDPYDVTTPEYKKIWEEDGANVLKYFKDSGVYDVFIICAAHGHVMYSAAKESDLGANLGHGTLKDSHMAKLWRTVKEVNGRAMVDFEPYAPSKRRTGGFHRSADS